MSISKSLSRSDLDKAARRLSCEIPTIVAVSTVESPVGGFLPDGRPTILFEAHIFSRYTGHKYDSEYPNISSPRWNRKLYGAAGAHQHDRLDIAAKLNRTAALNSASWGRFQVMGFNWQLCGYNSLQGFINAMYRSEGDHLQAFCSYVISRGLDDELRRKDWAAFAFGYNGPGYAANHYDTKLAAAYKQAAQ